MHVKVILDNNWIEDTVGKVNEEEELTIRGHFGMVDG
jgi:hypothetical protein